MKFKYSFRPATGEDFGFVRNLHRETLKEYVAQIWGWDEEQQEKLVRERFDPVKVQIIQSDGKDVGVFQIEERPDGWFLANIQLAPDYQRKGFGTQIIQDLIAKADEKNQRVTLTVLKPNPARHLYGRLGFVVVQKDDVRYEMRREPGSKGSIIRRANPKDARAIHEAHMRSIREVCSKDHTPEEIQGWGNRPFDQERRVNGILNHLAWVVERNGEIEGYSHLRIAEDAGIKIAHIHALYLTPKVLNQGLGYRLVHLMLDEAKTAKAEKVSLSSTLTAHAFYQRIGFRDDGPEEVVEIGGSHVRCYPMSMSLRTD
jgi:GNAT superfamily N-acetyltransferase